MLVNLITACHAPYLGKPLPHSSCKDCQTHFRTRTPSVYPRPPVKHASQRRLSFLDTESAHGIDVMPADVAAGLASGLWEGRQRSLAGTLSVTAPHDRSVFRPNFFLALPSVPSHTHSTTPCSCMFEHGLVWQPSFLRSKMSEASKTVGLGG